MKCLRIREKVLPLGHPDLCDIYSHLGSTYFSIGQYETGEEYITKSVRKSETDSQFDNLSLAKSHTLSGNYISKKENFTKQNSHSLNVSE
jgi:hypothetical protein